MSSAELDKDIFLLHINNRDTYITHPIPSGGVNGPKSAFSPRKVTLFYSDRNKNPELHSVTP
jgi:hypothetical protein